MLFKISLKNIRRSLKDYAVYFFTLVIGVSIFYIFNAVGSQAAMLRVEESRNDMVRLLTEILSIVSIFVAGVLALLIIYASRFLMKRRNREFALYMLLGMGKGKISAILLMETVIIGIGSLITGLVAGVGLSQLMSAVVANLFEADMTAFKFTVSGSAIIKTIVCFAVMYLFVMFFNSISVTKMKLIDLIQSGKRSETIHAKNPVLSVILFIIASVALGWAYYMVAYDFEHLNETKVIISICLGAVSTLLIFFSVSGLLLRILMSFKKLYHRGLNAFTFRQISSKVNTMIFAMTVICLMLFVTICALSASFSFRNAMNGNLRKYCPADAQIELTVYDSDRTYNVYVDIEESFQEAGCDLTDVFGEYAHFAAYNDKDVTLGDFFGPYLEDLQKQFRFFRFSAPATFVKISDYNALMDLYHRDRLTLKDDEYLVICNYDSMKKMLDLPLSTGLGITVFGNSLKPACNECVDGFIDLSNTAVCSGIFIIPDKAVDETQKVQDYFIGNYKQGSKEEVRAAENRLHEFIENSWLQWVGDTYGRDDVKYGGYWYDFATKSELYENAIGLTAILTFIGLYIGIVFLIASGAILALKTLSESVDSLPRYEMLRKIGAEESSVTGSLFIQTGIFFLLPLLLALFHSIFGMKFAKQVLEIVGTENVSTSITVTSAILLLIYGGYFLITFFSSKNIIKNRM
ncbi:MAG: ABC transporter permease [Lachnospiraceae bacterium]|nr:ABC transporter permease [Lachnospiraceae bacterium]